MEWWLQENDIKIHSIHNEGKSVVTEKFIRTLTLVRVGFLGVRFAVAGGVKLLSPVHSI